MSIVNVVSSQQAVSSRAVGSPKKDEAKEKPSNAEQPAVAVSVSGNGPTKGAQTAKRVAEPQLDNQVEARAFMDATKAGMLSDAGSTIMAQAHQNADRVGELVS